MEAVPLLPRPPVGDTIAIVDYVRQRGSVDYPLEAVPGEFTLWRRKLRQEAKRIGMRISVLRGDNVVIVVNPDHQPSADEKAALMDVMNAWAEGVMDPENAETLTYEEALEQRRRQRMRVVRDDEH